MNVPSASASNDVGANAIVIDPLTPTSAQPSTCGPPVSEPVAVSRVCGSSAIAPPSDVRYRFSGPPRSIPGPSPASHRMLAPENLPCRKSIDPVTSPTAPNT